MTPYKIFITLKDNNLAGPKAQNYTLAVNILSKPKVVSGLTGTTQIAKPQIQRELISGKVLEIDRYGNVVLQFYPFTIAQQITQILKNSHSIKAYTLEDDVEIEYLSANQNNLTFKLKVQRPELISVGQELDGIIFEIAKRIFLWNAYGNVSYELREGYQMESELSIQN